MMGDHTRRDGDDAGSELHIEVTPITPPPLGAGSPKSRSRRRARIWRTIVVAGVVLVALALLVSGFLPVGAPFTGWALSSTPRQIATMTPEPTVTLLGKVPTDCPPGNLVATFSPSFGPGMGVARLHVWLVGFNGPQATLHLAGGTHLTAHGWLYRLFLVAAPDVTRPITLSAMGIFGVTNPVWFSTNGPENTTATLTLNPQKTLPSSDGWRTWVMYIFITAGGCYLLNLQYGGREIGTFFAAGL